MSSHLPECDCYGRNHGECALCNGECVLCICNRLRSCEQRVREDMLDRCEEAAYTDLLALEDAMREAFGKGSDAARIVAGYRSVMPGFQQFYEEKPTPPPLPPSVGVPEKRWFR